MKKAVSLICVFILLVLSVGCGQTKETEKNSSASAAETAEYEKTFTELSEKYKDNGHPIAVLITNNGIIVMELFEDKAPISVANFTQLANSGYYDGLIFHRCIQNFMIQGGDPLGTGTGGPGYTIKGEFKANGVDTGLKHKRGTLSMARKGADVGTVSQYDTAGSQFFICVADYPSLDGLYAAFGNVLEGLETVDKIVAQKTDSNDKPLTSQVIKYARVALFGKELPSFEKIAE